MGEDDTIAGIKAMIGDPSERPTQAAQRLAGSLEEAHFRAECEQRPVMTIWGRNTVSVYPIGMRPY
jgi:ketopantoate reductase